MQERRSTHRPIPLESLKTCPDAIGLPDGYSKQKKIIGGKKPKVKI